MYFFFFFFSPFFLPCCFPCFVLFNGKVRRRVRMQRTHASLFLFYSKHFSCMRHHSPATHLWDRTLAVRRSGVWLCDLFRWKTTFFSNHVWLTDWLTDWLVCIKNQRTHFSKNPTTFFLTVPPSPSRYLHHIMEVETPTEDCLLLIYDLLKPIYQHKAKERLSRQEVTPTTTDRGTEERVARRREVFLPFSHT